MKITAYEARRKTHTTIAKRYVNEVEKCIEEAIAIGRYAAFYYVPESMSYPVLNALVDYIRSSDFSVKVLYNYNPWEDGCTKLYIEW